MSLGPSRRPKVLDSEEDGQSRKEKSARQFGNLDNVRDMMKVMTKADLKILQELSCTSPSLQLYLLPKL